ncbi:MAG: cysteine desulfurase NifS [Deltaproteobacteria bacterium]|nr:cysteine desulfurase NifS [Deltaproteobacteria bacterium]
MIYLDHNATTPVANEVIEAMNIALRKHFGNPSSFYNIARQARSILEISRRRVAESIGAEPEELIFTSGGSESDNMALRGVAGALKQKGRHIITTSIEHHAILKTCKDLEKDGYKVSYLPVDSNCRVDPMQVEKSITSGTILISVMCANNETGVIQPLEQIGTIARNHGIVFHTDAVQAIGKIPFDVNDLRVDLVSISGHKIYGPKGVGALYIRRGTPICPTITGGSQENGMRAGTENIPAIVGFAEAASLAASTLDEHARKTAELRDFLEAEIFKRLDAVSLNGGAAERLPNTTNICFEGIDGESILLYLDLMGICASSGSACSTGSAEPSHVLMAMDIDPRTAQGSIRFSLGKDNTKQEMGATLDALAKIVPKLRAISSL